MPILDIFSKRQKRKREEVPDVFQYDDIPREFRVKVVHILRDALGDTNDYEDHTQVVFETIHNSLCREYGIFRLHDAVLNGRFQTAVFEFFLNCEDMERTLDVIELSFGFVNNVARDYDFRDNTDVKIEPDEAISELNDRFLEHGIGYQFESGEIIRIDSKYIHAEAIKPTLDALLSDKMYAGANDEFLKAHEHYRHKRYKECLNDCLKAFESTMKAICQKREWTYKAHGTATNLLDVCFQNSLIPDFLRSQFDSIRSILGSGVPTVRNNLSGHGQGIEPKEVPQFMARYLLNLTATSILLLTDAEKELPS